MKKSAAVAFILVFVACAAVKLVPPSQADADRISQKFPGTTVADLDHGQTLFQQNCQRCHHLKNPASRTEDQWRKIVPVMAKRGKIDSTTEANILRYLIAMSKH